MIKKGLHKLSDQGVGTRELLFRIILIMGMVAMFFAILSNIILKESVLILIPLLCGMLFLVLALFISFRFRRMELPAMLLTASINWVMFPVIFFTSGGIESGAAVWFVLGMIFVFLLFRGKKRILVLSITTAIFLMTYLYAYRHPELILPLPSAQGVYIDSVLAVFMVSLTIGILISVQNVIYERERSISEKQKKELEDVNRSKSRFFANMSHEIRTPINTIIGLNEMTLREDISEEVRENAENIQNASKMLLSLINDILDLSKIEAGNMQIIPEQYETGALFSELVNIIWIRAHEKHLEFVMDIEKEIPSMLYGDEIRVRQILLNLLTNAVKYTKEGSITFSARILKKEENQVTLAFAVKDTGIGIRKENMMDLFSSFKRIDETNNKNIEGTGLGLSIASQLAERMGGKIEVDSIYTKGSIFTVTLEQSIVDETPIGSVDFLLKRNLNHQKYQQSFEAPDAHVLVVDDNEMNLLVATKLLRSTKVQVDTAKSGMECLKKTAETAYHVIFMDHKMPDMDGIETLKRIRRQEYSFCQETPVIALTASVMNGADRIYCNYGFDGYLAKPVNGALLEATLFKYLPAELVKYQDDWKEARMPADVSVIPYKKKKKLCIIADGACDLPESYAKEYDIKILYFYIETDKGRFQDVREITSHNLQQYLDTGWQRIVARCPETEEYERIYADALENAEQVLHITMAQHVDEESFARARSVAAGFDHVTVYDSGQLSGGMCILLLKAAKMAQDQKGVEEIRRELDGLKKRISASFIVPGPGNLVQSGQIKSGWKKLSDMLELHPVVSLSKSRILCRNAEGGEMEEAYQKYIKMQLSRTRIIDTRVAFLVSSGCSVQQMNAFKEQVANQIKFERIICQQASASMSAYCGTGMMGIVFLKSEKGKRI